MKFLKEANKQMFNYDLTYFQPIQFAEYKDGGFYDWHIDTYYQDWRTHLPLKKIVQAVVAQYHRLNLSGNLLPFPLQVQRQNQYCLYPFY